MSGRITATFDSLRRDRRGGFIAYITAGDPTPAHLQGILGALDRAGTDIIELGIPFSDPLADGPTIQAASGRALAAGMTVRKTLDAVRVFRASSQTPLVLFTYLNPIYAFGFERFAAEAAEAGADGLLVLDMPPEEETSNAELVSRKGLDAIRLLAPTTPPHRMAQVCEAAQGFLYYVSREGVTGEQTRLAENLLEQIDAIRAFTDLPVAVGFGISTSEQAAHVASKADAAVVGSAIVRTIAENAHSSDLLQVVQDFVAPLVQASHAAGGRQ